MSHHLRAISLALIVALVPLGAADAKKKKKKAFGVGMRACQQQSVSPTEDRFVFSMLAQYRKPRSQTPTNVRGASIVGTLTGPAVVNGKATGTTNSSGFATLTTVFNGAGDYTFKWTATKPGFKTFRGSVSITVEGPANAPCNIPLT